MYAYRIALTDKLRIMAAIAVCLDSQSRNVEPPVMAMVHRDRTMRVLSPEDAETLSESLQTALSLLASST